MHLQHQASCFHTTDQGAAPILPWLDLTALHADLRLVELRKPRELCQPRELHELRELCQLRQLRQLREPREPREPRELREHVGHACCDHTAGNRVHPKG